jgi:phosphoribosylformylglycinamidine cyclo-ligase
MILVVNPANVDAILASTDGYVIGECKWVITSFY